MAHDLALWLIATGIVALALESVGAAFVLAGLGVYLLS